MKFHQKTWTFPLAPSALPQRPVGGWLRRRLVPKGGVGCTLARVRPEDRMQQRHVPADRWLLGGARPHRLRGQRRSASGVNSVSVRRWVCQDRLRVVDVFGCGGSISWWLVPMERGVSAPQDLAFFNTCCLHGRGHLIQGDHVGGAISNAKKEFCQDTTRGARFKAACHPSCLRCHCPMVPQCTARMACPLALPLTCPTIDTVRQGFARHRQTGKAYTDAQAEACRRLRLRGSGTCGHSQAVHRAC